MMVVKEVALERYKNPREQKIGRQRSCVPLIKSARSAESAVQNSEFKFSGGPRSPFFGRATPVAQERAPTGFIPKLRTFSAAPLPWGP
jgi:hypothetical protein